MRGNEFLDKMELINPEYIEEAAKKPRSKKRRFIKWVAAAACFAAVAAISLQFFEREEPPVIIRPSENEFEEETPVPEKPTSESYESLPELLEYLGLNEIHGTEDSFIEIKGSEESYVTAEAEGIEITVQSSFAVNMTGEYAFHSGEDFVYITKLGEGKTENAGKIKGGADAVFVINEKLVLISENSSGKEKPERETSTRIRFFDISSPEEPVLSDEFVQKGALSACWLSGADIYTVTGEGVCACGFSRLDDPAGYYPSLSKNGGKIAWGDEDISILGTPERVYYSAVTVINGNNAEIAEKEAFYGNIEKIFYGAEWVAAAVCEGEKGASEVYAFGPDLGFCGKTDISEAFGDSGKTPEYSDAISVTEENGIFRIIGMHYDTEGNAALSAVSTDTQSEETFAEILTLEDYSGASVTEIQYNDNGAIICLGRTENRDNTGISLSAGFVFAEFSGSETKFHKSEITADYLNMQVGTSYGNPFGAFETLIPMGNGIFVRFSDPDEGPGGFDIFDFSSPENPLHIYDAEESLSGDDSFDYISHVYDEKTFGVLKVIHGEEVFFRDAGLSWCVFSLGEEPELLYEYPLEEDIPFYAGADSVGFGIFEAKGNLYYVMRDSECAKPLGE